MRSRTLLRNLRCRLTPEEWAERAARLAAINQEIDAEEARQAEQKAEMKARLATLESERQKLSGAVVRKEEHRDVECEEWLHEQPARVVVIRLDTREEVENRPMTDAERQRHLPVEA